MNVWPNDEYTGGDPQAIDTMSALRAELAQAHNDATGWRDKAARYAEELLNIGNDNDRLTAALAAAQVECGKALNEAERARELRQERDTARAELAACKERYDNCVMVLREWPMGNPHRPAAMKLYREWIDLEDGRELPPPTEVEHE